MAESRTAPNAEAVVLVCARQVVSSVFCAGIPNVWTDIAVAWATCKFSKIVCALLHSVQVLLRVAEYAVTTHAAILARSIWASTV